MPGTTTNASGASSSNVSENYMRVPHDRQPHGPGPGQPGGAAAGRGGALEKPAPGTPQQHASALAAAYGSPVAAAPIASAQPINSRQPRPGGHSIGAATGAATAVQNSPPADLVDLGLNEDSAVLAPIAMQEEEPVRLRQTSTACNATNTSSINHQSRSRATSMILAVHPSVSTLGNSRAPRADRACPHTMYPVRVPALMCSRHHTLRFL